MEVASLIVALCEKAEAIRKRELERTFATLKDLPPHAQKAIEALSVSITNKLLHRPIVYLENNSRGGENQENADVAVVRRILALEQVSNEFTHRGGRGQARASRRITEEDRGDAINAGGTILFPGSVTHS